ncbi:MAG TPA: ferredoxin reductase [Kofleriaceae bacterium]|jgi:ferredoxin-NADP reductase/ferredoxin
MKNVASMVARVASLIATPLVPADYVSLVRPLVLANRARVEAVRDEAPGVRTLVLRPGRGWRTHRAGQHVRIGVAVDGRIATRTFTIASSPDSRDLEITVKVQGRVSRALVEATPVGTIISLSLASGEFTIPEGAPIRPLFITAGSGITPVMSMLRTFALRGTMPDVAHVHFAREHVIFNAELRALAAAHPTYGLTIIDTSVDPRRLTAALLAELVPDFATRTAYACGPQRLLEQLPVQARTEHFGAVLAPVADAAPGLVQIGAAKLRSDGRTPLLRLAEEAGLAPRHGCRMGICHTCDVTLKSGCVRDLRTGARIDEPGTKIQLCVCAASGDVALSD